MSTATTTPAAQLAAALASLLSSSMDATVDGQVVTLTFADRTFLLAVAEKVADPCAGLRRNDTLTAEQAEEFPRRAIERCDQSHPAGRYVCTRTKGHTGVHVPTYGYSRGAEVCADAWGGDPTPGVPGMDKYASYKIGMRIDRADIGPSDNRCRDKNGGYGCTLVSRHSGVHVATVNGGEVQTDPWSEADKSDPFSSWSLTNKTNDPTEGYDEDDPCSHDIRGDECTRPDGHNGNHVSGNGSSVRDWCRPGECG